MPNPATGSSSGSQPWPRRYSAIVGDIFEDEIPPRAFTGFGAGRELDAEALRADTDNTPAASSRLSFLPPCLVLPRQPDEQSGRVGKRVLGAGDPETLVMLNIPCRSTIGELIHAIQESGFEGSFDYLFMPVKARDHRNKGFAFVAFANSRQSVLFQCAVCGMRFPFRTSTKEVALTSARSDFSVEQMHAPFVRGILQTKWGPVLIPSESVIHL